MSRVIADLPSGADFDTLLWQVSLTEIAGDCPFSDLPDVDRLFTVIEGDGVELASVDNATGATPRQRVAPLQPYAFRGDWRTTCRLLGGPVRVLNVMTRRWRFAATVEIHPAGGSIALAKAANEFVVAVGLRSGDAWLLDADAEEHATISPAAGEGHVAVVTLQRT